MRKVATVIAVIVTLWCLPASALAVLWLDDDGEFQISIVEAGQEFANGNGFGTEVMRLVTLARAVSGNFDTSGGLCKRAEV